MAKVNLNRDAANIPIPAGTDGCTKAYQDDGLRSDHPLQAEKAPGGFDAGTAQNHLQRSTSYRRGIYEDGQGGIRSERK